MKYIELNKQDVEWILHLSSFRLISGSDEKDVKQAERIVKKCKRYLTPIKTSSAKGKGRGLQYWVCEKLSKYLGLPFSQADDDAPISSRPMGQHNVDVILRGEAKKRFPFAIECKAQESINLNGWIEQAKSNGGDLDWLLVVKNNRLENPVICMDFDAFLKHFKGEQK